MDNGLLKKIDEFERPIYEDKLKEKNRIIAWSVTFTTLLEDFEIFNLLKNRIEKTISKKDIDWDKLTIGSVILIDSNVVRHYCVTKYDIDKEIELSLLNDDYLFKINIEIDKNRKKSNSAKVKYSESYRFKNTIQTKEIKTKSNSVRIDTLRRAIDYKAYFLNEVRKMGVKNG